MDTTPARPVEPPDVDGDDLAALEADLDDVAGHRPALQAEARAELTAERLPVTRATVTIRAVQILHRSRQEVAWAPPHSPHRPGARHRADTRPETG